MFKIEIQMHKKINSHILFLVSKIFFLSAFSQSPTDFVDPLIGTDNYGNTHPGATLPWGMVSVCPFNATEESVKFDGIGVKTAPYVYQNGPITGFSHVNLSGVGCPDHSVIQLMPVKGDIKEAYKKHSSEYSNENSQPGYYSVFLEDFQTNAEVSATLRSGLSKYTFSKGENHILIDLGAGLTNQKGGSIEIVSGDEIIGYCTVGNFCNGHKGNRLVYFVAKFSREADNFGVWQNDFLYQQYKRKTVGAGIGAYFSYDTNEGDTVLVKIGISWVSIDNARENLEFEQTGFDFNKIKQQAGQIWNKELGKIIVNGGTEEDKIKFYTALYHCLIHPNILQDINGQYPAMNSKKILHTTSNRYTVFSLWDTYRNLHPLLALVYPERQIEMVHSMLDMYKESGWLPKWELQGNETYVMVGDPATIVMVDTYQKGLRDFDIELAYEAMKKSAVSPRKSNPLRPGIDEYMATGFIPLGTKKVWGSLSTTLEYNLADWNISQLAKDLNYIQDYNYFHNRALSYRKFYDSQYKMLRPLEADSTFLEPFDPTLGENFEPSPGYVEGTPWQYTFFIPHDILGLKNLMGG